MNELCDVAWRMSEGCFRAIVEQSHDAYVVIAPDGTIIYASPSIVRVGGREPSEIVGEAFARWCRPEDLPELGQRFAEFQQRPGESMTIQYQFLHQDGSWRWVTATSTNLLSEPSVGGILCHLRDVTEERLAARARAQLAAIVESTEDAIVSTDLEGTIQTWNAGVERLFGYTAEEIVGRTVYELAAPELHAQVRENLLRGRRGEHIPTYEAHRLRKGGLPVTVAVTLSSLREANGEIVGLCAIYRDITRRKELEDQLRQSQKMEAIGRLAGGVAHDFNNLLMIISCNSESLLEELEEVDEHRALVMEIQEAGNRASALTRQLLAFSRKQMVQKESVDLNAVLSELQKMLVRIIGEDVKLMTELSPGIPSVSADPTQLQQIILNLAVNARDAMPQGGMLTLRTDNVILEGGYADDHAPMQPGPYVLLSVSDTGCGMSDATLVRMFEPFFTTKEQGKGTGLGLSTVYGIAKQFGGHIRVRSEVGHGTTFDIYFPALAEDASIHGTDSGKIILPRGSETVLVVEDEEAVRSVTSRMMRQLGYHVLVAESGVRALTAADEHTGTIDLLLTDVVMPGMGGRQLAERLRARWPRMKVLYLSGHTDDAVIRHGISASEVAFLQKPFSMAALAHRLREVLIC